ncbi:unnamed protein product [Ceutorhynchus assimilis]|uniref:Uncharacterized protein n=1 Tax=Ceutorhynchus assimilis TaxID=467358 RepID=A0A9N9QNG2_9CUCU|nr:unnamed protein product [Ceutorhynchus assimilis]
MEADFKQQLSELQNSLRELLVLQKGGSSEESISVEQRYLETECVDITKVEYVCFSSNKSLPGKLDDSLNLAQFKNWKIKFENYLLYQGVNINSTGEVTALLSSFTQNILDVVQFVLGISIKLRLYMF